MKFKFQSFVDLSTSASSMQVIQWSVGGSEVINRCRHLFGAYKYFKLGKISIKMVPASTLPVDPLGLSYRDSDPQTVDPRDQMNPGLVRITNGEDIFTDVSSLPEDKQIAVYNAMMLDPRWSKFMLQSGFRRSAYPLYWQIGQLHQDKYPGATTNMHISPALDGTVTVGSVFAYRQNLGESEGGYAASRADAGSSAHGLFQVGHKGRLGFLPTDYFQTVPTSSDSRFTTEGGLNNVPEVSVITCVLPKAYKTIYYYRVFITEEVIFSGLRSAPFPAVIEGAGTDPTYWSGIDTFLSASPQPVSPVSPMYNELGKNNNGGGNLP